MAVMKHDTRIRELCAQAVASQDPDQVRRILSELREALREHINDQLRLILAEYPFLLDDLVKPPLDSRPTSR